MLTLNDNQLVRDELARYDHKPLSEKTVLINGQPKPYKEKVAALLATANFDQHVFPITGGNPDYIKRYVHELVQGQVTPDSRFLGKRA